MIAINTLAIGMASLFAVAAADHGHQISRAHHHNPLAERSENHLQKRFSGTGTYYITGLGACGIYNNPSDKIVALNSAQFGGGYPGPHCFKMITICKGSNCHGAQITDECPTCDYGSLDLSESLFQQFASTDDGVFPMTWTFNDGSSDPTTTKKPDPPKTTSTKEPEPTKTTKEPEPEPTTTSKEHTSTSKKHTTTSTTPETTSTPEPTTSTSTSTSSVPTTTSTSEAKSTVSTTSEAITSASPSATAGSGSGSGSGSATSDSNWVNMAQMMLAMGRLASVAHEGH